MGLMRVAKSSIRVIKPAGLSPISHKSPTSNHAAMHTPPKPVAPRVPRAKKVGGAPAGFKTTVGVVGSGKHASPFQRTSNPAGPYAAKHRKGY